MRKPKFRIPNTMICGTAPAPRPCAHRKPRRYRTLLGHNKIKTALRYTRSDDEDRRAAMVAPEKSQSRHKRRTGGEKKG